MGMTMGVDGGRDYCLLGVIGRAALKEETHPMDLRVKEFGR